MFGLNAVVNLTTTGLNLNEPAKFMIFNLTASSGLVSVN